MIDKNNHSNASDDAQAQSRIDSAKAAVGDTLGHARERAGETIGAAREKLGEGIDVARETVGHAYQTAREKTADVYASARDAATHARERAGAGVEENPLAVLIGGIALGALVGALVPRSRREIEALSPLGERIRTAAGEATRAAKEAGIGKLDELGLNADALKSKAQGVVDQALSAARETGTAATSAAREAV